MNKKLFIFAAFGAVVACGEEPPAAKEEVIRLVRVEPVETSGGGAKRSFSGTVKAGAETKLSFKVGGTLSSFKLKVGDKLEKGAVVARLESQEQSLQVEAAQARVAQGEAQLRNAQANNDRVRSLYENNTATQAELDLARSSFDSSKAALKGAKKQLQLAQQQAGNTVLRAPVSGVVAKVSSEDGENVGPGQAIAIVNSGTLSKVEVALPESIIGGAKEGGACTVRVDALDGSEFAATITEIGVTTGGVGTTFPLVATFDEPTDKVRPGMIARVSIAFGDAETEPKIRVNPKAATEDRGGRYVYIASPTTGVFAEVKRRKVKVGELSSAGLHIESGVKPGDLVITAGLSFLEEGKKVRLPKEVLEKKKDQTKPKEAPELTKKGAE
jgi:RND family efflux transporter MFP subunit